MRIPPVRRGVSALVVIVVLLGVIAIVSLARLETSAQLSTQVQRVRLATLAELQARSAIQEALQRLVGDLNTPGTPLFRRLREHLGEPWSELELTDLVAFEPSSLAPTWGRQGVSAEAVAYDSRVHLFSPRGFPEAGELDEWTALLSLEATGEVRDARLAVRRHVEERYELRMVRVGLPRPFDQLSFLAPLAAVTDTARAGQVREELLAVQPRLVREVLANLSHQLDPALRPRLEAIMAGMIPADQQAARTPVLPTEPALVAGFHGVKRYAYRNLDLAARMEADLTLARNLETKVRGLPLGSTEQVEAIYQLVDCYSQGLAQAWRYGVQNRLHPGDGGEAMGPFLARLDPEVVAARAMLVGTPELPQVARWLAGEVGIDGVLDLRATKEKVTLEGELQGRTTVVVGTGGMRLQNLNRQAQARGDRLLVVCAGGEVELSGDVHAQVVVLPQSAAKLETSGALRMDPSTQLVGSLLAPFAGAGQLELDGLAIPFLAQRAPWPASQAAEENDGGGYQVVVSPDSIWTESEAR